MEWHTRGIPRFALLSALRLLNESFPNPITCFQSGAFDFFGIREYERQEFLRCHPYQRHEERLDQANGFYKRHLTTRCGRLELSVPRTRSGLFRSQVIRRYKRRDPAVDEAIKNVFLRGVSTRQAGSVLASLLDEAVSAATVSQVAKVLDGVVEKFHRRALQDHYEYLLLDGVSVRIRLVGAVRKPMVLCAYGITRAGKRELIDFLITKAEGEDTWKGFLLELQRRGLKGQALRMVTSDGGAGLAKALAFVWPRSSALLGAQAAQPE